MPRAGTTKPKVNDILRTFSSNEKKLAEEFVQNLGIGTKDDLYYYAILWCKEKLDKSKGKYILTKTEERKFNSTSGRFKINIYGEINQYEIQDKRFVEDKTQTTPQATQNLRRARVGRPPSGRAPQSRPRPPRPKIQVTIDKTEVEKGQSYVVSWKSENAVLVSNSRGFSQPIPDVELSGSRTITANRIGSKTFKITVVNENGLSAAGSAEIKIVREQTATQQPTATPQPTTRTTRITRTVGTRTTRLTNANNLSGNTRVLTDINKSLENIAKNVENFAKFLKGVRKIEMRDRENENRRRREGLLEATKGVGAKLLEKTIAPIRNIFEKIINFFIFILLGRLFTEFLKWFNDPANAGKVKALTRFFNDFWWLIGGAALWFFTPLGSLVNGLVKTLAGFTKLLLANPLLTVGIAAGAAAGLGFLKEQQLIEESAKKQGTSVPKRGSGNLFEEIGKAFNPGQLGSSFVTPLGLASGGLITPQTGMRIKGAGPDTQLTALTPGETVLQKGARERQIAATGIDPLMFNIGPNANRPRTLGSNISAMNTGGVVGSKNPNLSAADYNALLAIAAAEDFKNIQGRADVAQSLYNRLFAAKQYGEKFSPTGGVNTLKNLITGQGQFQPTFGNPNDWLNITDRKTAAIALSNYKKIPIDHAMRVLSETDRALRNPVMQSAARAHVQGRTFFLGSSQHGNMKAGDVVRGKDSNFFSHWYTEGSQYQRERGNVAAPLPTNVLPKTKPKPKPKKPPERAWWDPRKYMGMRRGGGFKVSADMPAISMGSADRHLAILQAGEFVVPKITVQKIGLKFFDNLVARTDENSNAARLSPITNNDYYMPPIDYAPGMSQILSLPAISKAAGGITPSASTEVPSISPISAMSSDVRKTYSEIYGIG